MKDFPRQKLREIILQYGRSLCDEPRRCEAFLQDFCGQYRKEVSVLVIALKERVPNELLASQSSTPPVVLLARLTKRLQDNVSLTEDSARWAVESWGLALGVISEAAITSFPLSSPPQVSMDFESSPPPVPESYGREMMSKSPSSPIYQKRFKYAGFWKRFVAALIDGFILNLISFILFIFLGSIVYDPYYEEESLLIAYSLSALIQIPVVWLYSALLESSVKQGTLGKMALGIKVTDLRGNRISFGQATVRHFGKILSALTLGIGYILAAVTTKKQALHDMIASCLVIKKQ